MEETKPPPRTIRFAGRSFMAFVLRPEPPVDEWLAEFDSFSKRSPGFFVGRPVVVDISAMPLKRPDLVHIVTELRCRHITIMGLDGVKPGDVGADARGLPPLLTGSRTSEQSFAIDPEPAKPREAGDAKPAPPPVLRTGAALLLDESIRSGRSVVHMEGDVTVVGQVASGAEIVAAGSIHVYGALKGRAIAGAAGNRRARIFCRSMEAELVAIDGLYKTADDLDRRLRGQAVQAWLEGDALKIAGFSERERGR